MAIENREVTYWDLRVQVQVLDALVGVLHALALTYVTHDT